MASLAAHEKEALSAADALPHEVWATLLIETDLTCCNERHQDLLLPIDGSQVPAKPATYLLLV